jgi:putative beta-1,4-xylosyltransferase IRX9
LDDEVDFDESSLAIRESDIPMKKVLIIVTITSARPQQPYYLNQLAHVLKAVLAPLLWLVVEWHEQSYETTKTLLQSTQVEEVVCR